MPCIECDEAKAVSRLSKVLTTMTVDTVVSVSPHTGSNTDGSKAKHRDLPLPVGKLTNTVCRAR